MENISAGAHYQSKRQEQDLKEDEKKREREKETSQDAKIIWRGGEGRERGRGASWRLGRHIENVSFTITSLVYTTHSFYTLMQISSRQITIVNNYYYQGRWRGGPGPRPGLVPGSRLTAK